MNLDDNCAVLVTVADACRMTSLSRTMLNRYRAAGQFPLAVELGERRVAFVRREVLAWIDARIAARRVVADNDNQRTARVVA